VTIQDIQQWAATQSQTIPLDMLVIDYLGLVDPDRAVSGMESGSNLNRVIRQAKLMAMSLGIPVVSPHQANREGLKEADKAGGRYKISALANANEAERSSDVVYYVYLDNTLRDQRELIVGNLKTRNGPVIDQFRVYANPSTHIIDNLRVGDMPIVDGLPDGYDLC